MMPAAHVGVSLRVVVLTSGDWGWETVAAVHAAPGVEVVGMLRAPAYQRRSLRVRVRNAWRRHGPVGVARLATAKVTGALGLGRQESSGPVVAPVSGVPLFELPGFNSPETLAALDELRADVGILDGTSIIREPVFSRPRLGMVNLHCGRLPFYRGSPPVFWELYNGEREVGVTVHRVSATLDGGAILFQECVPLDPAPAGDPVAYAERVWRDELRPRGVRLLAECMRAFATELPADRQQPAGVGTTYRPPTHRDLAELRRRVRMRRAGADPRSTTAT
jgi:hypothetical protein